MKKNLIGIVLSLLLLSGCTALQTKDTEATSTLTESSKQIIPVELAGMQAYDFTNPSDVVNHSTAIVRVQISAAGTVYMDNVNNPGIPLTKYTASVLEVIRGEKIDATISIVQLGGLISVQELRANSDRETNAKRGLDAYSEAAAASTYLDFSLESSYRLDAGNEYVVLLSYNQALQAYMPSGDGYGVYLSGTTVAKKSQASARSSDQLTNAKSGDVIVLSDILKGE